MSFDFFMTLLFVVCAPIINVAYYAPPFPCEYVGVCYGRYAKEKTSKSEVPSLIVFDK